MFADVLVAETGSGALPVGFFDGIAIWAVVYRPHSSAPACWGDGVGPAVLTLSGVVLVGLGVTYLAFGMVRLWCLPTRTAVERLPLESVHSYVTVIPPSNSRSPPSR